MVTIGIDPHKQTHTAVAVDELGVQRRAADGRRRGVRASGSCWSGAARWMPSGCG